MVIDVGSHKYMFLIILKDAGTFNLNNIKMQHKTAIFTAI